MRVTRIRAGRRTPGLRPQHAATVRILGDVCSAEVTGGEVGSTELTFIPGVVGGSRGEFDLGTAASIPLVLQAVVPALSLAERRYDLTLVGGTDVPWSPTTDYVERVVSPAMASAGIRFSLKVERRGYYPKGGGRVVVHVEPCAGVSGLDLSARRAGVLRTSVVSRCGRLPSSVAERQAGAAEVTLRAGGVEVGERMVSPEASASPGSSVLVSTASDGAFLGGDSIGARGKPAEEVGHEAAASFLESYSSGAAIDAHLADMLAPVLCLSRLPSKLSVPRVTGHLTTSLHVATALTGAEAAIVVASDGGRALLSIRPAGAK